MKNKRIIYWGGNDQTIIPRMGACGDGAEPSGGSGGGAGSGNTPPKEPGGIGGAFAGLGDLLGELGLMAVDMAKGELVQALVDGALVTFQKNRDPNPETLAGLGIDFPEADGFEGFERTAARGDLPGVGGDDASTQLGDLGFDITSPQTLDLGFGKQEFEDKGASSGFDQNGLPNPPEFIGQEIVDEDGNLWVYKDPPGEWINFGQVEPQFLSQGVNDEVPIYADYESTIVEVQNKDTILAEKSWVQVANEVGSVGTVQPNLEIKFDDWYVEYDLSKEDLYTYLRFDDDNRSLVVNYKRDIETYPDYPYSIVYKLYEPLPDNISKGDLFYVVKQMSQPYEERVQLIDFVDETLSDVVLRQPKWDTTQHADSYFFPRDSRFKTYEELTTSNQTIKDTIENEVISGSFSDSIELSGVDHRQFTNFAKFSSVEDRLKNFKYKLQQIELFESQSLELSGISGSATYEYTSSLNMKARKIKNEFTPFEKYMFYDSSSYVSSSIGIFHDNAWPKKSGTGTNLDPYVLYAVTESTAETWYDNQIISASNYDRANRDRLIENIPNHIKDDTNNTPFLTFLNMTGEHFDKVWTYINQIPQIYDRRQKLDEGLSKDLIYHVGRSLGFYLNDGQDLVDLPNYLTGAQVTGSDSTSSTFSDTPQRDISREIWKRILNNMPFFLKTKGTIRSLKGLINCYGIPSSILRVREYGGPNPATDSEPAYQITRKFTKALDFKGEQYVETTWANDTNSGRKPDTVQLRFRSEAASGSSQVLFQAGDDWSLRLKDNSSTDNYGYVSFVISGSGTGTSEVFELQSIELPVYDGEFYSVMLTRMSASVGDDGKHYSGSSDGQLTVDTTSQNILYNLHVGRYDSGTKRVLRQSWVSGSTKVAGYNGAFVGNETGYIGGKPGSNFGTQLSGSMMEFRYWNTALNSGSFFNQIAAPKAYDGNHASSSYTDLVLRYGLDDDKDLSSSTSIKDTSSDQSYTSDGVANGYTSGIVPHFRSIVDEQKAKIPNIGPNRRVENKVRIESNRLVFGALSVDKRSELSAYDLAPLDSNKVGIYFSPTDMINEDIILSVADLDFDQYIGDPRDKYKRRYRQLEDISTTYWQKYTGPNNFWDYIRLIRFYDASIFDQLRRMIPARANASLGILIEPNILERKKEVIGAPPNYDDLYVEGFVEGVNQSGSAESLSYTASIDLDAQLSQSGKYITYTGSVDLDAQFTQSGLYMTYTGSVSEDIFRTPSLYILSSSLSGWGGGEEKYGNFTIKIGGPEKIFSEVLQPNITGSVLSEHNYERRFFYTTQASASANNYHSSSLHRSDKQSLYQDNQMFRLVYKGSLQTKKTTLDKLDPVTVILTSPTTLISKEGGDSKLEVL
tara:strand:+ start:378 stop:4466 length:4089 start_codon:yes stop_codon:yes gene_type:complete